MIFILAKVPHRASENARSMPNYKNCLITYEGDNVVRLSLNDNDKWKY